jgi:uncharacterized protein DUF6701
MDHAVDRSAAGRGRSRARERDLHAVGRMGREAGFVMDFMRGMLPDGTRRRAGGAARAGRLAGALVALAGALLCPPADAQVVFRSSAQASVAAGATITLRGIGAAATINPVAGGACAPSEFITPAIPGGSNGDLLIAVVINRDNATLTVSGAAWNTLHSDNQSAHRTRVYWRLATGSDTLTVTKTGTCTANGVMVGRVARYSDVDTVQPFEPTVRFGYQTIAAVVNHGGGTIDATLPNSLSLFAALVSDNNTVNAPTPATFTTAFSTQTGTGNDAAIALFHKLETTIGAKGPYSATMSGADPSTGVFAIVRPAPSLTITVPAGTAVGDVMIASVAVRPCSNAALPCTVTVLAHSDWTLVDSRFQPAGGGTGGNGNQLFVYQRVVTGTEPSSYSWYFAGTPTHSGAAGGILSFSGVDTTNPIVAQQGTLTPSGSSHTAPQVDVGSVTNTMLVSTHASNSSTTWAFPPGMTERVDASSSPPPDALGLSLEVNTETRAAAGLTGTRTATYTTPGTPANDTGATHMLALRPAVVVVPVPGSFNAFETSTGAGAITGPVYTKLVGTNFTLDVVAILSGAQLAAFTDTVQVDLVTGSTGGANCPGSPVAIAGTSQNVNLTSGRGTTVAFNTASAYPDVRVRVRYPVASPTVTSCSTDNFTIRPVVFSAPVSSDMTNTGSSGAPNKKAGDAFNLSVSGGAGYTGTPSVDSTKITAHAGAIQAGTVGGGFGAANPVSGTATGASFTYSEVGNFTVGVNGVYDDTFTSASSDQGNGDCTNDFSTTLVGGRYGCKFGNSVTSAAIGRFTPDHFDVALNAPVFTPACGSFTYVGQGFSYSTAPVITVTARNSAGLGNAITRNYTGAWQKITTGSLTYPGGTAKGYRAFTGTLDVTNAPANPTITPGGAGSEGTVALGFSLGAPGLLFQRAAEVAPFDADISLALNVIDEDAVAYASNPAKFGNEVAGGGMVFSDLNPLTTGDKSMRFGRLQLGAGGGSQLVALSLPVEAQYWNGTAFVTNAADNCTTLSAANVGLGNFIGLASGDTTPAIAGAFSSGRKTLTLSPPGGSKVGTVDVVLNLNTAAGAFSSCTAFAPPPTPTAADLAHLRGRWCPPGPNYDRDATARARFGVYRGAEEVIFVRENY